jgi:GMP synthase-like glutamine amidotransferase
MFHWHNDTFDLPRLPPPSNPSPPNAPTGNALLSSSKLCKNQAFRFKSRLFGFQYHFEFTEPDIEAVIVAGRQDYAKALGADKERKIRQDTAKFMPRYTRQGQQILRNFVQYLKVY